MRPLVGASITFHARGYIKNARTAVHVFVLARSNTSATPDRHSDFVSRLQNEQRCNPSVTCSARRRRPTSRLVPDSGAASSR